MSTRAPVVFEDLTAWREHRRGLKGSLGFVPTMGALHAGHASLLEASVRDNDHTVLSVYVNPTQFNNPADLDGYPETLAADLEVAQQLGVDYVILPTYEQMYADEFRYQVDEKELSRELCGANRPGHFTGVLTVVMKLFNLVAPERAYFGEKDYQQLELIRGMADAFFMPIEVIGCPTVRETDGLAMSSRNKLLDPRGRCRATELHRALKLDECDARIRQRLTKAGFKVDYIESKYARRFGAVVVTTAEGEVRLIDNVELEVGSR